jgi:hypothetical protein
MTRVESGMYLTEPCIKDPQIKKLGTKIKVYKRHKFQNPCMNFGKFIECPLKCHKPKHCLSRAINSEFICKVILLGGQRAGCLSMGARAIALSVVRRNVITCMKMVVNAGSITNGTKNKKANKLKVPSRTKKAVV